MSQYINPMNDFFMRYLLGSKDSENNCRGFVNAVLQDIDFPTVSSLTILNPFNLKEYLGHKELVGLTPHGSIFALLSRSKPPACFWKAAIE